MERVRILYRGEPLWESDLVSVDRDRERLLLAGVQSEPTPVEVMVVDEEGETVELLGYLAAPWLTVV